MLSYLKFHLREFRGLRGGLFDCDCACAAPPDTTALANASTESAQMMKDLGEDQLTESKRQYDANSAIAKPVVDAQLGIMNQTAAQGADYYDYMKSQQRPVERALNDAALKDTSGEDFAARNNVTAAQTDAASQLLNGANTIRDTSNANADVLRRGSNDLAGEVGTGSNSIADQLSRTGTNVAGAIRANSAKYEGDIGKDVSLYTGGNQGIYDKYGADIEGDVGRSVADARAGQAQATNSAMRQAMRYGVSVPLAAGSTAVANAQAIAAAANGARTTGIDKARANLGTGVGMKQNLFQTSGNQLISAGGIEADTAKGAAAAREAGLQTSVALKDSGNRSAIDLAQSGTRDALSMTQAGLQGQVTSAATARDLGIADTARDLGKKMDVAGLYRGLPGASTGAYSVANASGNSAVGNQMAPGASYMAGLGQGANTIGSGRQMALGGLGSILNAQTSYTNGVNGAMSGGGDATGSVIGAAGGIAAAFI